MKLDFLSPKNFQEALDLAAKHPGYSILAGGTDICVLMNSRMVKPRGLINIWGIDELRGIKEEKDYIEIGALTTHAELVDSELIKKHLPALFDACRTIGARQIQNRGTIGGNVMNASPAGDTLPVLLAYDAEVVVAGKGGRRAVRFTDFYKGYRETALKKGEIVAGFKLPKVKRGERAAFLKVGTRKAQAISKVMGCFRINLKGKTVQDIAIAFGSVAPVPLRLTGAEKLLKNKELTPDLIDEVVGKVMAQVQPIDDIRSTAAYRRHICGVLLKRFLRGQALT